MLNTQLIAEFQTIAREGRSGSLTVSAGDYSRRFYFEDGQVMLLDLCTDKELLLAKTFLDYHKIDEAMHQLSCQLYRQNGTKIAETLEKQRVVHGEESAFVQRSMVEQLLVSVFSNPHEGLTWQDEDDENIEPYDLDVSALKIKIETDMLVAMAQTRIREQDAVFAVIDDFGKVIGLTEVDAGGMQLNSMEQNVLRMVDGQKTIRDLARSMRDSTQNIACYVKSLMDHGLVKTMDEPAGGSRIMKALGAETYQQVTGHAPPTTQVMPPAQGGDDAAEQQDDEEFTVYTESYSPSAGGGGGGGRLVLITVILAGVVLAGGLGFLVWKSQKTKQMVNDLQVKLAHDVGQGEWSVAEQHIVEAFDLAATDIALRERLDQVCANVRSGLLARLQRVEDMIGEGRVDIAETQLDHFPTELPSSSRIWDQETSRRLVAMRGALVDAKEALAIERAELIKTMDLLLGSGDAKATVVTISNVSNALLKDELEDRLEAWRRVQLDELQQDGRGSIGARLRKLDMVEDANPDEQELAQIAQLRSRLEGVLETVRTQLDKARGFLEQGDIPAAGALIAQLEVQGRNLEFPSEMAELRRSRDQLTDLLKDGRQRLQDAIANDMRASSLALTVKRVRSDLEDYPKLLANEQLNQDLVLCEAIAELAERPTMDEELAGIDALLAKEGNGAETTAMMTARKEAIAATIAQAEAALGDARSLLEARKAQEAKRRYQSIIEQVVWQRCEVIAIAKQEISAAEALILEQENDKDELYKAMQANDIVAVRTIAGKLGMDTLPLYLTSQPNGAIITQGEKEIGVTPMLIKDLTGAERAEASFTFSLPGYNAQQVDALDAKAGWQIAVLLERNATAVIAIGQQLTAEPAAIQDRLWLAGGRGIFALAVDAKQPDHYWMHADASTAAPRLENPVYAAPSWQDDLVQVTTRDNFVLAVDPANGAVERRGIPAETNYPVTVFHSELIVDRALEIVVDLDHDILAFDRRSSTVVWTLDSDVPVACAPMVLGRLLLVAYQDGRLLALDADNGDLLDEAAIGEDVAAAWNAGQALTGYAGAQSWSWNGADLTISELPFQAIKGGPGIALTNENRVHILDGETWQEVGVNRIKLIGPPVRWGTHAALVSQHRVVVLGKRPFSVESQADMLLPCVVGDHLAVSSTDGVVRFYAP